jgi:hypothetical protein
MSTDHTEPPADGGGYTAPENSPDPNTHWYAGIRGAFRMDGPAMQEWAYMHDDVLAESYDELEPGDDCDEA